MLYRVTEMDDFHQTQKHKDHTELCARLVDCIFDIADEAYKHQQDMDVTETDSRNWHEWQQLFVESKVIENTLPNLAKMITEETGGAETLELHLHGESVAKLDELELVDYLQNKGQWPATLVSQSPVTMEQVLNPPAEVVVPTGKGKATAKDKAAAETVSFEPADLELSSQAENNYLLGDALEQIIQINFEERARLRHPQTASWLPLKICLAGYPFAGKKTQATFIAKKFGL